MSEALTITRLRPADLLRLERQPSQQMLLGVDGTMTAEEAELLASMPEAWTLSRGDVPIACFGISELFPGKHGLAWSLLGAGLGTRAHLMLTRFAIERLEATPLIRVETYARCVDVEHLLARTPDLDSGHLVHLAMLFPSAECRWARRLGFRPAHVLRRYGAADETMMLFERIRGA